MITFENSGDFKKTDNFLDAMLNKNVFSVLDKYGARGVQALASATPSDSGLTAASWTYEITRSKGSYSIVWSNTNIKDGLPIAILIQYGHGTGTGGYIPGQDYINPALKPIFDQILNEAWKAVTNS